MHQGFFDNYRRFYQTSQTTPVPNRLNYRHAFLIERNRHLINGARVLDLASHDGRWSFAALHAGATSVTGVEARESLVESARTTFQEYGIAQASANFVVADALEAMRAMLPGMFDVIFCFGFFYHTMHHFGIMQECARLSPRAVIIDTAISASPLPMVELREVDGTAEWNSTETNQAGNGKALEGSPSLPAIIMMLQHLGFEPAIHNWHDGTVTDWSEISDYRDRIRTTVVGTRR